MSTKKSNINKTPKISTRDYDEEPSHDNVTGEGCVRKDNVVNVRNEEELENTKSDRPQLRKHNRQNAGNSKSKLVANTSNGSRKAIDGHMSHMKKKGCDDMSRDNHQNMSLEKNIADQNVYVTRENSDIVVEADGEEGEFFKCGFSECHSSYCDEVSLNAHITEAHQTMTLFPCYYCSCLWSTCKNLLAHLPSHIGLLPYRCVQCDICFAKRSFLRDHLNKMHQVNKPFKCQFAGCAFVTNVWSEFKAHNSIIHPLEDAYRCFACKTEMNSREAFFEHIEMYMVTLICCSYCTMKARTRQRILRHSNNIHQGLDVRFTVQITVKCVSETRELEAPKSVPTCTVSSDQALFRSHRNVACEEESSRGENVKCHELGYNHNLAFQCSLCPFVSDELQEFSLHLANHCGKTSHSFRHYKCVHCQYTSNVMTLMEEHLQEYHESELFKFEVVQEVVKSNPVPEYVHPSSDASSDSAQHVIHINDAPQSIRGTQHKHVHSGVRQGASRIQPKYAKGDSSQSVPSTRQNVVMPKSGYSASHNSTKCNVEDDTTRHVITDNAQPRSRSNVSYGDIVLKRKLLIVLERCDVLMGIAKENSTAGGNEDTHSPKKIQKFHNGTRSVKNSRDQDNIEASAQECRNETNTKMRNSQRDIYPGTCDPKDDTCTETLDSHDDTCTDRHDSQDDTCTEKHDSHDDTCTETHDSQDVTCTETNDSHDGTCMETHDSQDDINPETHDSQDDTCTETRDFHDYTCTETHDSHDDTCTETHESHDDTCTETHDSHDDTCTETRDSRDDTCTETHDSHDDTCAETHDSHDGTSTETHDSQDDINTETHDSQDDINTKTHDYQDGTCVETHDSHDAPCTETHDSHDGTCMETHDSQDDINTETHDSHDDTCTETHYSHDDTSTEKHDSHDDTCTETHDYRDGTCMETHDYQDDVNTDTHDSHDDTCTETHDFHGDTCTETHDSHDGTCTETRDSHDDTCTETHDSQDGTCVETHDSQDDINTETHDSQEDTCLKTHDSHDDTCTETRDSHDYTCTETHDYQDDTCTETHDSHDYTCTETRDAHDDINTETHESHDDTCMETHDSQDDTRAKTRAFRSVTRTETRVPQEDIRTETINSRDETCTESQDDTSIEIQHSVDSFSTHPIEDNTVTTGPVDAVQTLHTEPEEESPEINTIRCRVPENTKYRCNVCVFHCQTWELFETHMAEAHYYRIVKPDARSPPQTIIAVPIKKTSHTLNPHRRGRYVCDDCTFATDVKGNIQRHREGHSDKLPSGYKCSFCSYSSLHRFVITRHAKKYHTCELSGQPYDVSILSSKIVAIQMENPQTTTECSKPIERNIQSSDVPCTENDPDLPLSGIPVSR